MRDYCKHWYTSCRCRRLAGVGAKLFVVLSLLLFMTASYAQFQLGNARVTSVVPVNDPGFPNPACVRQDTPPRGTEHWDVRQDHTYRVRLEGVTECSDDRIHVHIFNPFRSVDDPDDCYAPQCLEAIRVGEGIYEFEVFFPPISSKTYYIRYCTNSDCSAGGFLARRSDGGNAPSLLRLAHFDPRTCEFIREDKLCTPLCLPSFKLRLECNPQEIPDCDALFNEVREICKVWYDCQLSLVDCRITEESAPDLGPCWKRRRYEFDVIDCEFRFYTIGATYDYDSVIEVNWQEDEYPPVFEQFPEDTDLGCNPRDDQLPSCESVLAQVVVSDACDNRNRDDDNVVVECFAGEIEELSKCRYRQVFTVRATDKCRNVAERSVTYTWKIDYEPPVVNNVPREVNLGCNPAEPPSCDWLIATYGIEAKDNCVEEGNAPQLYCEAGPIEELSKCRFRQTFRFWAVDKSECGNRSQDYYTTVTWKIDYEPPVVNNVPEAVDLGCNPAELPSCDWLIATYGIEAKDNCVEEGNAPQLYCEAGEVEELSKCRFRQTFRFWAVDKSECGNRSQDYYTTVTWKIDYEPPVVNNVPREVNLGCNPAELPSCDWLIATYGIEAKDNCVEEGNAPQLYCEAGEVEELSKCRFRQTFRFWAVDKSECGNRSQDYYTTVTWKIDYEPPVVNNVPREVNLGCNPAELPSCDWLIATYGIEAKDNCVEEGNAPQLYCEAGPIEELSKCRFRQTFRFWAVDKSECGNRSQDYYATVTWKIDAEPPVVNNVPREVNLGCNPAEPPSCDWLIATYGIEAKDNCVEEGNAPQLYCEAGEVEELSKCRFRQTFRFWAVDKSECGNRSQDYYATVTWKIDAEPPVVNNVPAEVNLGCNPAELPSCDWLIATYGIEAKDNCVEEGNAPQLYCEAGPIEELSKCRFRQTFRFWAVDKSECGNRSQDYYATVTWKIDAEPPVVNNVPREVNLGCNPAEPPSCDWLIATYGIEAKDNCVEEGNAPQLYCEAGPIEELSKCRFRQTFRFWAVDKSECGNRSQDYYATVTWKIDAEPPVVNNVPREVNLGCNPAEPPSCDWLIATYGIEAKDNCVEEGNAPQLYCEAGPIEELSKCRYRQTFRFWAVDKSECGNRSQDYYATVTWKIDAEPPVVNNVPREVNLGCNPAELPSCDWLIATYGIEAKDNCVEEGNAPQLYCEAGPIEELSKCRYRQTFRFWAVDKSECGNRSQDYYATVTWKIDAEPPVVNNVPREVNLGCNPAELPSCDWLIATYGIEAKDNCVEEGNAPQLYCEAGPIEELSKCRYRQTFRFWAVDKSECGNRSQDYYATVTWKIDAEPPVVNNVPEAVDLGCNPAEPPSCDWLIAEYGIEAKDNCVEEGNAPQLYCEAGEVEELPNCRYRQTFRFWAVDKSECGNRSQDYYATVTWQIDTIPPVINNLPRGGKLPCNTRPSCEYLIERYNINVKDNCDKEPQLFCEAGELEQLEDCQFRQTFRFWAVDKCGNRTQDYFVTFFWKEDTEPPVLHNLPEGGDLGCNPSELPTCETIGGGVTATDNCDPNPRVTCFSNDLQIGCLRIRSFNFVAVDECGNVATAKVFYHWTVDTTPPVVRCPDNIVVQADPKECFMEVRWRAKADDDCDPNPRLVCIPPSGSLFPLGTTTVTCTATDRCGNTASCSFTVTVLGFICGTKFHDLNGNGIRDRGEPGLEGWTIELVDPATNTVLQTVVTGPDGRYCFLGLQLGDYIVREVLQPGWVNTTPIERRVNLPRDCGKQVDFGNRRSQ